MAAMNHCAKCKWRMYDTCYVYAHDPLLGAQTCSPSEPLTCLEFSAVRVTRAKTVQTRDKDFDRGRPCWAPLPIRKLRSQS